MPGPPIDIRDDMPTLDMGAPMPGPPIDILGPGAMDIRRVVACFMSSAPDDNAGMPPLSRVFICDVVTGPSVTRLVLLILLTAVAA